MTALTKIQERIDAAPAELHDRLLRAADTAMIEEMRREFAEDAEPLDVISADELLTTDWPEPVWAVPELLPEGLTILAGRPKIGKSWLALQIAHAVAAGGRALGEAVDVGSTLYLALEDPPRRLAERMKKQNWPAGLDADFATLDPFSQRIGDLKNGGGERLARQMEQRKYRLVVIDTLSRAVSGDQSDVEAMTQALTPVHETANSQHAAVILVDHHRKPGALNNPDAVGDILGSTAKGAMADSVWGLYRERGKAGAKLAVTGREIIEKTFAIEMDWQIGCWQMEGDAHELEITERRQEIIEALFYLGKSGLNEIAETVEQPKSHTHTRLQDLVGEGFVSREQEGRRVYYNLTDKGRGAL